MSLCLVCVLSVNNVPLYWEHLFYVFCVPYFFRILILFLILAYIPIPCLSNIVSYYKIKTGKLFQFTVTINVAAAHKNFAVLVQ